jgi:AraC-like DNA-binding protein
VLITGNWYADDGMELFNGHDRFNHLNPILQPRYLPQLFRTSDGDVLMVGCSDNKGQPLDTLIVERMKGEPFRDPFFDTWRPLHFDLPINNDTYFIGDTDKGDYAYLMPVKNNNGEMAIAEVRDTVFSLLPTDYPVPTATQWGRIDYYTPFYADRPHQRGYIMACDSTGRQYALCVDYAKKPAQLTLYHTDPLTDVYTLTVPVLTEDGNLMLTGIKPTIKYNFNFTPKPQVWLLRLTGKDSSAPVKSMNFWLWVFMALAVVVILVLIYWRHRRTGMSIVESKGTVVNDELMGYISQVMEEQQPYLNTKLRLSDLAALLDVSQNDISACINTQKGCSFSTFINGYRIDYAKQLLISQPDMKISHVATESGFTSEQTFHTNFKQITGMTPRQWLSQTAESTKEL